MGGTIAERIKNLYDLLNSNQFAQLALESSSNWKVLQTVDYINQSIVSYHRMDFFASDGSHFHVTRQLTDIANHQDPTYSYIFSNVWGGKDIAPEESLAKYTSHFHNLIQNRFYPGLVASNLFEEFKNGDRVESVANPSEHYSYVGVDPFVKGQCFIRNAQKIVTASINEIRKLNTVK